MAVRWKRWVFGLPAGLFFGSAAISGIMEGANKHHAAPAVSEAAANPLPPLPPAEAQLIKTVDDYAARFQGAANDMAAGALRPERGRAICAPGNGLQSGKGAVRDWIGTVETLSSNQEGKGVLELRLSPSLTVGTTNNALSDIGWNTLIPVNSALQRTASSLVVGQVVRFSGGFLSDSTDCLKELSITARGGMTAPWFVFRFTDVKPLPGS